jgi:hypothetical protein
MFRYLFIIKIFEKNLVKVSSFSLKQVIVKFITFVAVI